MHARYDSPTSEAYQLSQSSRSDLSIATYLPKGLRTTKSVVVVRVRWRIVVAVGDPNVLCIIVPGPATQDAGTST